MFKALPEKYEPLNEFTVLDYVRTRPELERIFKPGEALTAEEVGDGNLNLVFKVRAANEPSRTIVLKQALPYVRLVGEGWPMPADRARIEAESMFVERRLIPEHVPEVYFFDEEMYAIAMRNLDDHIIMRRGVMEGIQYPHFAKHIGKFLAKTLGHTSDLLMDYAEKKQAVAQFINPELCKITEDLIFTEPYRETERNLFHDELRPQVEALQADDALRVEVAKMKFKFMTAAEALLHGDLHTGSIMVNQEDTYVIDSEFAFYGPMSFDTGCIIGELFLSYASHEVRSKDEATRADFREYLTDSVIELWNVFVAEFQKEVWDNVDPINMPKAFQDDFMLQLLRDTAGMGACKMMRRVIGLAGVADIREIEDVTDKSVAASLALNMAQGLIMRRDEINTIDDLVNIATSYQPTYPFEG